MKNELSKGTENQPPVEGSANNGHSRKYTWLSDLVRAIFKPFLKRSKNEKELTVKRTEITKDRYIQHEITYKEKSSSDD